MFEPSPQNTITATPTFATPEAQPPHPPEPIAVVPVAVEPIAVVPVAVVPIKVVQSPVEAPVAQAVVAQPVVAAPTVVAAPVVTPIFAPAMALSPAASPSPRASWWREMSALGRWGVGGAATVLGLSLVAGGVSAGLYSSWRSANRIAPNVVIQGVPVGDMRPAEARSALKQRFGALKVRFETPEKIYTQTLYQMGGRVLIDQAVWHAFQVGRASRKSLPANALAVWQARQEPTHMALGMKWDKSALRRRMNLVSRQYFKAPTDARLQFTQADLVIVPDENGRSINPGATLTSLQKRYRVGRDVIRASVGPVRAKVTAQDLEGRNVLMGTYSTDFDSDLWGRTRNIHVAASHVDGLVMMPGEKFSFNQRTGERTWDKGYRMGHIFEDRGNGAEVVDGLAGGVCQVSSTIFNAVRKTNQALPEKVFLRINERNHHSLPVSYVPSGLDATVAWPHKDFRFTNTLDHPVFLRAVVEGSHLTVSVWGRIPSNASAPGNEHAPQPPTQFAQASANS